MNRKQGFTLIELLIVIAIIGILATIIIVAYSGLQARSRDSKRKGDLQAMASGANLYYADHKYYPGGKADGTTNQAYSVSTIALAPDATYICDAPPSAGGAQWAKVAFAEWKCLVFSGYLSQWPSDPSANYSYFVIGQSSSAALGKNSTGYKIISDPRSANDSFETSNDVSADCITAAGEFADKAVDVSGFGAPTACRRFQVSNNASMAATSVTATITTAP